jgi:hypothetical protein
MALQAAVLGGTEVGCYRAINMQMIVSIVDASRRLGRNSPTVDYQMRSYVAQPHLLEDKWLDDVPHYGIAVPGDWGFIRNPSYVSGVSGHGDGGHNFIYVGWGLERLWTIDTLLSDQQRSMSQEYGVQCTIDDTVMVPSKEIFK